LFASRAALYSAAARIAHTVQNTSWQTLASATHVDIDTPYGAIRVRGSGDDLHEDTKAFLLHVDLGGDDTYLSEIASNLTGANPVSVAVDVDGDDLYSYREAMTSTRTDLLPADVDGRFSGSDRHGEVSLSSRGRQGSARNGIAMLFDLAGNDRYRTLRMGQGYAHHGVGVLFDGDGEDSYVAEAAAQGSAQLGIGLLIDAGEGNDTMRAFTMAQGFAFAGAIGAVIDGGGDDRYDCDRGAPETGGRPLYLFPGLEDRANTSFCQGAGFGRRSGNPRDALSGGLGILRDRGGDDTYVASVYAQGAGYWQATGVLSDGGGDDRYDGVYYVQGAGVHFANGILADADGDDRYGMTFEIEKLSQGAGHDFGVGVLIDERGRDTYRVPGFGAGGSSCNGLGLFIDNAGDDHYTSRTLHSTGIGNAGSCGASRPTAISAGIMIDAGGLDRYDYPTSPTLRSPGDGLTWGHTLHDLVSEHGAGRDTDMDSGVHLGR